MSREEPPATVRECAVTSDTQLSPEEKEVTITFAKDTELCRVTSEVATITKWLQSVEESTFEWVRTNDDGEIVACSATVPKGILRFQGSARNSNTHSRMVSYGDLR